MNRLLLLLLVFTFSCAERELQLPVTTNNDITEILDVSPVYIFYDDETGEADLNRNNMISTTNWLVNVDKRLTLKQVFPHLQYLQDKRHGDSAHKNENAKNYFTCFNEETKNLSFIEFTDVRYLNDSSQINIDFGDMKQQININFESAESIKLDFKAEVISFNTDSNLKNFDYNLMSGFISHGEISITIYLKENLLFQDYITFKSILNQIKYDKININTIEFIY